MYNCLKSYVWHWPEIHFIKGILFTKDVSNFQMTVNILLSKENIHIYKYVCLLFFQDGRSMYSISVRNSIHGKKRWNVLFMKASFIWDVKILQKLLFMLFHKQLATENWLLDIYIICIYIYYIVYIYISGIIYNLYRYIDMNIVWFSSPQNFSSSNVIEFV